MPGSVESGLLNGQYYAYSPIELTFRSDRSGCTRGPVPNASAQLLTDNT